MLFKMTERKKVSTFVRQEESTWKWKITLTFSLFSSSSPVHGCSCSCCIQVIKSNFGPEESTFFLWIKTIYLTRSFSPKETCCWTFHNLFLFFLLHLLSRDSDGCPAEIVHGHSFFVRFILLVFYTFFIELDKNKELKVYIRNATVSADRVSVRGILMLGTINKYFVPRKKIPGISHVTQRKFYNNIFYTRSVPRVKFSPYCWSLNLLNFLYHSARMDSHFQPFYAPLSRSKSYFFFRKTPHPTKILLIITTLLCVEEKYFCCSSTCLPQSWTI